MTHGKSILSLPVFAIIIAIVTYIVFFYISISAQVMISYDKIKNKS